MTIDDWNLWLGRSMEEIAPGRPQFHLFSTDDGTLMRIPGEISGRHPLVLRHYAQREDYNPYSPMLGWVRDLLSEGTSPDLLLEEADVYFYQRPVFAAWLWGADKTREEILPYEEKWERDQYFLSLWNLFVRVLDGRFAICVVENAQEIGVSLMSAILAWKEKVQHGRVLFLLAQDHRKEPLGATRSENWARLSECLGVWKHLGLVRDDPDGTRRQRRYSLRDLDRALSDLARLLDFFCWDEAEDLVGRLYGFYLRHPRNFPMHSLMRLLDLYGLLHYRLGKYLQAVHSWAHLLSLLPPASIAERCRVTRHLAQCFLMLREDQKASALSIRAWDLAQQSGDKTAIFYALHARLWSEQHLRTLTPGEWKRDFRRYLEWGQELDLSNSLAYWLVNPYLMDSVEQVSEATYYQQWGIELCEKYKNYFLLSYGYLNIGYYWSIKGDYEKVMECYDSSEKLKRRIQRLEELPQVYNSRGYFLMNVGDYVKAQENYLQALAGLYRFRSSLEIGLTLFNLAMNAFRSELWERAEKDFSRVLTFMRGLDIQSLIFHGKREVLIHLGICQVHTGRLTRALETWLKVGQEPGNLANLEEQLLYFLLKANITYHDGGVAKLPSIFREAEAFLVAHKTDLRFLVPRFYLDFGRLLAMATFHSQASAAWKQGYLESFQLPNAAIRLKLQAAINGSDSVDDPGIQLTEPGETVEWIVDLARQFKQQREVQKNKATLDVLLSFQDLLSGMNTPEEIVQETVRLIERGFLFDGVVLFEMDAGYPKTLLKSPSLDDDTVEVFRKLVPDFRSQGAQLVVSDLSQPPWSVTDLNPPFGVVTVSAEFYGEFNLHLCARFALDFSYSPHELRVLQLMVLQVATVVGRRRREQQLSEENLALRKAAHKDVLTGVYNRRGIQEKLLEEVNRLKRYNNGTCTVVLVEIINMDTLNRQVGFPTGDAVLRASASYLDRLVRAVDSVGRFGGALFCVVLPETDGNGALNLIQRIQEKFHSFHFQSSAGETSADLDLCFGAAEWRGVDENLMDRAGVALKKAMERDGRYYLDPGESSE